MEIVFVNFGFLLIQVINIHQLFDNPTYHILLLTLLSLTVGLDSLIQK